MSSINEIKNEISTTPSNIPRDLLKNYTPISIIYNSIGLFIILSFIGAINFLSLKKTLILNLNNSDVKRGILNNKNILTLNNFIMFLVISSILFSYIFGVYYKIILNGKDNLSASLLILFCIFSIMGITYISTSPILLPFIDIVKIFENTIGYLIINIINSSKIQTVLDILFSHKKFSSNYPFPNMTVSYTFMISVLTTDNYSNILSLLDSSDDNPNKNNNYDYRISTKEDIINKFNNNNNIEKLDKKILRDIQDNTDNIISKDTSNEKKDECYNFIKYYCKEQLSEYILLKNFIGQLCWVFISALITILITIKYLSYENK